jgi:hypothetical protein
MCLRYLLCSSSSLSCLCMVELFFWAMPLSFKDIFVLINIIHINVVGDVFTCLVGWFGFNMI